MTDDIEARFEDIERRLAALEAAPREPAAATAAAAWVVPDWLQPLDELFQSGNPARALTEADKLRAQAYATNSTTQLEELHAYLSVVALTVKYPKLGRVMSAIDRNLETPRPERRTDLRPFPTSQAAPPAEGLVADAGDGARDASED